MFIKLESGQLINLFWVIDVIYDSHDKTKLIILLMNGVNIIQAYDTEQEAQQAKHDIDECMENAVATLEPIVVDELPTEDIKPNRIYILRTPESEEGDIFAEYMYINGEWELLGVQKGNLNNYYTKTQIDEMLKWNEYSNNP